MNIEKILNELKFSDRNTQIICSVPHAGLKSRIHTVGQVKENTPGIVLGDREPYLREQTIGTFISELNTFGQRFQENDFLIQSAFELSDEEYELRYYKLTSIKAKAGEIVLLSKESELSELREIHQEPELE